jgi:hypothetical protein
MNQIINKDDLLARIQHEQQLAYDHQKDTPEPNDEFKIEVQGFLDNAWCEGRIQGFNSALDAINELSKDDPMEKVRELVAWLESEINHPGWETNPHGMTTLNVVKDKLRELFPDLTTGEKS